ncbi:hypothetical protein KCU91_g1165, partial [Aureobasidium melanogenum]
MDLELAKTLGCVVLKGKYIDNIAESSPSPSPQKPNTPYHVTVFTKAEIKELDDQQQIQIEQLLKKPFNSQPPIDLGVAIHGPVAFNVLFWPEGNRIRHLAGLSSKDLHITLSLKDKHNIDKGIHAITRCKTLTTEQVDQIISACCTLATNSETDRDYAMEIIQFVSRSYVSCLTEKSFDQAWRLLFKFSSKTDSSKLAYEYLNLYPNSVAALLRAAHHCEMPQQAKQAMFMFAQAACLLPATSETIRSQCVEALVRCSEHTEFGPLFLDHEAEDWKDNPMLYSEYRDVFQNPTLRRLIQTEILRTRAIVDDASLITKLPSVASNQDVFTPIRGELYRLPRFFRWLTPFRLAVMSTPRCREDIEALIALGITLVVTLTEEEPLPTKWFENTPCRNLFLPVRNYQAPTNEQVDTFIQSMDDLPIEEAVLVHCGGGKGRAGTFAACYLIARGFEVTSSKSWTGEEYLCMYPAEAMKLLRHMRPGSIETTEQETFVKDYAQYLISGKEKVAVQETIISESQDSLELDGELPKSPSLIVCCGIPGSGLVFLQKILHKQMFVAEADTTAHETNLTRASDLPERPFIHKFPRTRHLFNIGSASRDDLILSSSDAQAFLQASDPSTTIVVEEKVDGANLGISLDSSGAFKVQNRSHYVNSKSHAQFKKLDKWLDDHYEGLSIVLDAANSQPGRWILYGEWLYAKHSIYYTTLPDLFLAFDLFDTETGTFLSRDALSKRLNGTNIHQVSQLEVQSLDEQSLLDVVRTRKSGFYDGVIEGVYLRRQKDGKTIDRAKIVRSDFIAGDEHWNRRGVTPNIVEGYH